MFVGASKFLRWLKCHPQTKQRSAVSPLRCWRSRLGFAWAAQTAALPASSKAVGFFLFRLLSQVGFPTWARAAIASCTRPGQQRPQRQGSRVWSPDGTDPSRRRAHKLGWNLKKMAITEQLWALSGYGEAKLLRMEFVRVSNVWMSLNNLHCPEK